MNCTVSMYRSKGEWILWKTSQGISESNNFLQQIHINSKSEEYQKTGIDRWRVLVADFDSDIADKLLDDWYDDPHQDIIKIIDDIIKTKKAIMLVEFHTEEEIIKEETISREYASKILNKILDGALIELETGGIVE